MKNAYPVLTEVRHDGATYVEGDVIDLEPKDAKPLLEAGAIAASAEAPATKSKGK